MKTLIIYDKEGYIISTRSGYPAPREPVGLPFLSVEIPQGKQIKLTEGIGVDTNKNPHEVILEDIPKTETELLKEQIEQQNKAIADLTMAMAMSQAPTV